MSRRAKRPAASKEDEEVEAGQDQLGFKTHIPGGADDEDTGGDNEPSKKKVKVSSKTPHSELPKRQTTLPNIKVKSNGSSKARKVNFLGVYGGKHYDKHRFFVTQATRDVLELSRKKYHNTEKVKEDEENNYSSGNDPTGVNEYSWWFTCALSAENARMIRKQKGTVFNCKAAIRDYTFKDKQDPKNPWKGYMIKPNKLKASKDLTEALEEHLGRSAGDDEDDKDDDDDDDDEDQQSTDNE